MVHPKHILNSHHSVEWGQESSTAAILRQGLSLAWDSLRKPICQISQPQSSSCFCLPNAEITSVNHCTSFYELNFLTRMGSGDQT